MTAFNDFMIEMLNHRYRGKAQRLKMPSIGEAHFAVDHAAGGDLSNMAGQTLFLLPDGEFVLPNYRDGWKEYMHSIGNILEPETTFREILCSRERFLYMRRQSSRNNNLVCRLLLEKKACLLEFAKPNKPNDECFVAKRFVAHAIARSGIEPLLSGPVTLY